jgi:hypothetical protein
MATSTNKNLACGVGCMRLVRPVRPKPAQAGGWAAQEPPQQRLRQPALDARSLSRHRSRLKGLMTKVRIPKSHVREISHAWFRSGAGRVTGPPTVTWVALIPTEPYFPRGFLDTTAIQPSFEQSSIEIST